MRYQTIDEKELIVPLIHPTPFVTKVKTRNQLVHKVLNDVLLFKTHF